MKIFIPLSLCLLLAMPAPAAKNIITQSTPSDCGPAALATLLAIYLGVPTTEKEMVALTDSKPDTGTTLLGLEKAALAKGCEADSFRMSEATLRGQLKTYPTPVIVRTLNPEPHFCLVLAMDDNTVFLADPAAGNILMEKNAFLKRWLLPVPGKTGEREGYVFIAAGADGYVDEERRAVILKGLAMQKRNLETMRPQLPSFRR